MLSIIGFITVFTIVLLLISEKVSPIVALVLIPIIGAFMAGFNIAEIGGFFTEGIESVFNIVIMFIFAILFFGIMNDAGLFDPMIKKMISLTHGNVVAVSVGTVLVGIITHLDGAGASTFLITIPALLPVYKKLKMSPYLLMLLVATSIGVMNMMPWGGPIGRAAAVIAMDPTDLWRPLIPLQLISIVLLIGLAVILGLRERRRIFKNHSNQYFPPEDTVVKQSEIINEQNEVINHKSSSLSRPKLFWFNIILSFIVITILVWGIIPAGLVFMIGLSIGLLVNYPEVFEQTKRISFHAPNALLMASIILAAGCLLGILEGTGMLDAMAIDAISILPSFLVPYLHLIIGFFGLPFELILSTDAYYFALLPVVEQIVSNYGVSSTATVYAVAIGNIIGTMISPFAPALWLGLGLAELDMGRHIRYSFIWMWGFSLIVLLIAVVLGIIQV